MEGGGVPEPYWRLGAEPKEGEASSRGRLFMAAPGGSFSGGSNWVEVGFDSIRFGAVNACKREEDEEGKEGRGERESWGDGGALA